jgi:transcriptional regulator with XRE-family HTH domain
MRKDRENRYKICRENAGLTQEQAAELLYVSARQLSDYENGRARVSDEMTAGMARAYNAPLLAWWHVKQGPLGGFFPEIQTPKTNGDMAFQIILANGELDKAETEIRQILSDGVIGEDEREQYDGCIQTIKDVNGKLTSVIVYSEQTERFGE